MRALDGPTIEATVDAMTTVPGRILDPAPGGDHRAGPPGARGRGGIRPAGRELERLGAGIWEDPADDDAHIGWVRGFVDRIRPGLADGRGLWQLQQCRRVGGAVRAAYGEERFARLQRMKARL